MPEKSKNGYLGDRIIFKGPTPCQPNTRKDLLTPAVSTIEEQKQGNISINTLSHSVDNAAGTLPQIQLSKEQPTSTTGTAIISTNIEIYTSDSALHCMNAKAFLREQARLREKMALNVLNRTKKHPAATHLCLDTLCIKGRVN